LQNTIELSDVSRSFGRVRAVDRLNLTIASGTATALMGPNGAGKTTLLKLCATLLAPDSGRIRLAGLDPATDGAAVRTRTAYLGHDSHLYADLTAEENLRFTARLHRLADGHRRIDDALDRIGLRAAARRPVRTFSRGMQQRCALARILLQQPGVLLLDEPATGLDVTARDVLYEIVRELRRNGTTVLVTTHDVSECVAICDSAILLARGRVTWSGAVGPADRATLEERLRSPLASA